MPLFSIEKTDKAFLAIAIGVVALTAACLPLAQRLDDQSQRMRLMYEDRELMEWLQYRSVTDTGQAVPAELSDGDSVRIAGEQFTPSAGVTVVVRTRDADTYCVQVSNQYGDVSRWACLDEENPPSDPDAPLNTGF